MQLLSVVIFQLGMTLHRLYRTSACAAGMGTLEHNQAPAALILPFSPACFAFPLH